MLAVPALALLIAQPGSPCAEDPGRPAAVHLCRAQEHLSAYRPDARGNPENDKHLLEAVEDLKLATTAARGTGDLTTAALKLVRLFAPDRLNEPDKAVPVLQHLIEAEPENLEARFTLAAVLESEGELGQAAQLLEQTHDAFPEERLAATQLASFTHRVAVRVWDTVVRSADLDAATRVAQLEEASRTESRALDIDPEFVDAIATKEQIIRHLAEGEENAAKRAALLTEADTLRVRAVRLRQGRGLGSLARRAAPGEGASGAGSEWLRPASRTYRGGSGGSPALAPETAPAAATAAAPAAAPRGEDVPPPRRVKFVPPAYPEDAIQMGVEGAVSIEVRIDEQGKVVDAKVIKSIPLLDQAALDAVRQWEYAPTLKDGRPIQLSATVTVAFSLK